MIIVCLGGWRHIPGVVKKQRNGILLFRDFQAIQNVNVSV